MMVLGIAAITALGLMFVKPELTDEFQAISPFFKEAADIDEPAPVSLATIATDTAINQAANAADAQLIGDAKQQRSVTNWLSKRYRVANDATDMLVSAAYLTAKEIKLDPLLILSVMAIESGLNPFAESPVGAQGLMQVMSKVHQEKFDDLGGVKAALNPVANIRVGAQILKEYVTRGGSVEAGLKLYVGAAMSDSDGGYGNKVIAEYKRLKDVANGKSVPTFTVNTVNASITAKPAIIKVNETRVEAEHLAAI
nr:transglycosylase SLT domain-containing protein [Solimicrobium silvestre]